MDGSGVDVFSSYELRLESARSRLASGRWARRVEARDFSVEQMEHFLLWFVSQGIAMTRPVGDWIRRAGKRCVALGYEELGKSLQDHARHVAGNDELYRHDALLLLARWNEHGPTISAERLLTWAPGGGVLSYWKLHEDLIDSSTPYAQIAVEYEIERLALELGPTFVSTAIAVCGPGIRKCLSFVVEHILLDQGHTNFNARRVREFLTSHPEALPALVAAGEAALDAYGEYLEDCLELASSGAELA